MKLTYFVVLHLLVLLLASTNFTLLTATIGRSSLQWTFGGWAYANGWGYAYHSSYSFLQICVYLLAYTSGIALYMRFMRPSILRRIAIAICVVGAASFVVESSHWVFDHNLSLFASFPVLLIALDVWIITVAFREKNQLANV